MKKLLILLIVLAAVLSGCNRRMPAQIAATTLPVYEFTSSLCQGTDLMVTQLVTEEVSCLHNYTLQVSQMRTIESAKIVVCNGAGLEDFLTDALENTNLLIDASAEIALSCGHDHEGHNHEHDPHIWLSCENAKQMCRTICAELTALYPNYKTQLDNNLVVLLNRLDALQMYGESQLQQLSSRELITFHDGFAYFADSFGLKILKAVEEESGSEASAQELIELIELINKNQLPAIFTEINGSTAAAQVIATETGVRIYALDMAMSGESYFDAMYRNIDTVKEALG